MDHDGPEDWESDQAPGYTGDDPGSLDTPLGSDTSADLPEPTNDELPDGPADDADGQHEPGGFEPQHGDDLSLSYSDYEPAPGDTDPGIDGHDESDPRFDEPADDADGMSPEPVSGAHPDRDLVGDDPQWAGEDPFPPQLDVGDPPEPVDGFPWSDPAVLGEAHDTDAAADAPGSPPVDDLLAYDAQEMPAGADPWHALAGSEDPATSSLARWWSPGS